MTETQDSGKKFLGLFWLVAALAVGAGLALGLDFFIALIPWSAEKALARIFPLDPPGLRCQNAGAREVFKKIEARLRRADDSGFDFKIDFLSDAQVNAFAGLGGQIFVFGGLVQQAHSPEELAGVLAHEIEHVKRRHILQGVLVKLILSAGVDSKILSSLLGLHFSRHQEAEADEGGLRRLQDAKISTKGFEDFFARMQDAGLATALLSDHPASSDRAELARKYETPGASRLLSPEEWKTLKKICP